MPSPPDSPYTYWLSDEIVDSLRNVLNSRGWTPYDPTLHSRWNLQWKGTRYSQSEYGGTAHQQRINHFQKTSGICKKDTLARNMRRMATSYGSSLYSFSPLTYILPREHAALLTHMSSLAEPTTWICKPSSSSQGKNICLIREASQLSYDVNTVVQTYIGNPLLIGGYKFDLRIYALVTSFRPLTVYLYDLGLVRFSTQKYDPHSIDNIYSHLTNASINKWSPNIDEEKDVVGKGCKWTLDQLWAYLKEKGVDTGLIWEKIRDIILLTLLPIVPDVPDNPRCFELFGFDIMLDDCLKPWLIEVNASPAIAITTEQDQNVKWPLLNDLFDVLGFPSRSPTPSNPSTSTSTFESTSTSPSTSDPEDKENTPKSQSTSEIKHLSPIKKPRASSIQHTPPKRRSTLTTSKTPQQPRVARASSLTTSTLSSSARKPPPIHSTLAKRAASTKKPSLAASTSSSTSTSTPSLPLSHRIGQFQSIFPFNGETQAAAQTISHQSVSAPHSQPAPLLFQAFTKTVVTQIKQRQTSYKRREQASVMTLPYVESVKSGMEIGSTEIISTSNPITAQ